MDGVSPGLHSGPDDDDGNDDEEDDFQVQLHVNG